ncbi:hypothetical protein [Nannocystis punicea]|uniref:Uncharacterized protein n=1 Tax=Nannocystis punicea TaxID=2995304 RepID=A0ABY7H5F6_9BACT|nr:hypothetical protein [Nannocystis poenicansa]WAS94521.1 hypothetical protein O0S08_00025 [Nannocystis poenicansa]
MRRVLAFHLWQGWRITRSTAVPPEAVPERFTMRSCVDSDRKVQSSEAPRQDHVAFEFRLDPTRPVVDRGGHTRILQIGMCSIGCSFGEHPVEIWLVNENKSRTLTSLRHIAEDLQPVWAVLVPSHFRGPSIAEARCAELAHHVSLENIYISDRLLSDERLRSLLDGLNLVRWRGGAFVSGDESSLARSCFPLIRNWALSHTE